MKQITFVTEASVFGDQKGTAEILSTADVKNIALQIARQEDQALADEANRELRKLNSRLEAMRKAAEDLGKKAEVAGKMAAENRTGQMVANAQETFRSIVRESLTPILEAGTGQILDNQQAIQAEQKVLKDEATGVKLSIAALEERMGRLEAENKHLKAELDALRQGAGTPTRERGREGVSRTK